MTKLWMGYEFCNSIDLTGEKANRTVELLRQFGILNAVQS
jgi:hypothetical protein